MQLPVRLCLSASGRDSRHPIGDLLCEDDQQTVEIRERASDPEKAVRRRRPQGGLFRPVSRLSEQ